MKDENVSLFSSSGWDYLCHQANVVLLQVSAEGTILFANSFARELTGLPLVGGPLSSLMVFPDQGNPLVWLEPSTAPRMMNIKVAAGLPQTLYVTTVPCNEDYLFYGQTDPAEQERLRREVLELNHELTALGRELSLANAELNRLNKLKNQFLGMASHDLRKPTGLILNYAEFILDAESLDPDSRVEMMLQRIRSSASSMAGIINDFLDVAMIEAGQLNLDIQIVDPASLIDEAMALVEIPAQKRNISLIVEIENSLPQLRVDGAKLEQVLTNLLSNAVEYSPDGGNVTVGCSRQRETLAFRVVDEGAGLSQEEQQRLFREFSGRDELKPSGERSIGLGLVIVRKIVEAHGGTIHVESDPGHGSCFSFELPSSCLSTASC